MLHHGSCRRCRSREGSRRGNKGDQLFGAELGEVRLWILRPRRERPAFLLRRRGEVVAATGRAHGGGEVGTSGGRESGSDYGEERFLFSLGVPYFRLSEATYPITRQRKPAQPNQTPVTFSGSGAKLANQTHRLC